MAEGYTCRIIFSGSVQEYYCNMFLGKQVSGSFHEWILSYT